jgi:hypothetical protein
MLYDIMVKAAQNCKGLNDCLPVRLLLQLLYRLPYLPQPYELQRNLPSPSQRT